MSRYSGALAYSKAEGTGERSWRFSRSVNREVVGALVAPGGLLPDLEENVVQKRGGAEAEEIWRQPLRPERLVHEHEVLDRLLRSADAACRLDPDAPAGLLVDVPNGFEHDEDDRQRRGRLDLAGGRLDEVRAACDREEARPPHVVVRAELARLEDDLQVGGAARLLDLAHLLIDLRVVPGEEGAAVDDHVHLVGAELDDPRGFRDLEVSGRLAGWERRGDRGDLHPAPGEPLARVRHEGRVDTDCGDRRHGQVGGIGPERLRAERRRLPRGVRPFERREVAHADGEIEREELRLALDRALREGRRPLLGPDLVDRADARQPRLERKLEPARQYGCLRHGPSVARCRTWAASPWLAWHKRHTGRNLPPASPNALWPRPW